MARKLAHYTILIDRRLAPVAVRPTASFAKIGSYQSCSYTGQRAMVHLIIDRPFVAGSTLLGPSRSTTWCAGLIRALTILAVACPLVYGQVENEPVLRLE